MRPTALAAFLAACVAAACAPRSQVAAPQPDGGATSAAPAPTATAATPIAQFRPPESTGSLPRPYMEGARQFLVHPGQFWQHMVEDIRPGDEVVFPSGFQVSQVVSGLRGTRERPIYLRSRDNVPAAVAAAGGGLVLRDAEHVVIENLVFINPDEAALTVEPATADGRVQGIVVRQCEVRGSRGGAEQDGIRIRRARDVRILGIRVEGWQDAALEIDSSDEVTIHSVVTAGLARGEARRAAIAVRGECTNVQVTSGAFSGEPKVGVDIGGGSAAEAPVPTIVRFEYCLFNAAATPLLVRGAHGVLLSHCTIWEPRDAMVSTPGPGPVTRVFVDRCIGAWVPGSLRAFSLHGPGVREADVVFGTNLWHSAELPTAWDAIGRPFGTQQGEQRTDIDPSLDPATLKPRNPAAAGFGAQ